jgi:hypothetical protein
MLQNVVLEDKLLLMDVLLVDVILILVTTIVVKKVVIVLFGLVLLPLFLIETDLFVLNAIADHVKINVTLMLRILELVAVLVSAQDLLLLEKTLMLSVKLL